VDIGRERQMPVSIGFIGAGGIARYHAEGLAKLEDAKIVAACDVEEERAQSMASLYGARAYRDHHDMLEKEKLDALFICVPPFAHTDAELIAAQKCIHMLIEKPVALTVEKAIEIRDAVLKSGVVTSVGYQMRYLDATHRALSLLEGQTVGMTLGAWMGGFPGVPWWRVKGMSGGQMLEQTTHIVDLSRFLAGDIAEVWAAYGLRALGGTPNLDVSDVGTVCVKFRSGAVGTISNTCILDQGYTVGVTVICKNLVLECSGDRLKTIRPGVTEEFKGTTDARRVMHEAFIKAIRTGDRSGIMSPYEDAVKSLAVSIAANESAESGAPAKVRV
jgi:predicted dehydrogenase